MMKAPTSRATAAKTRMKMPKKSTSSLPRVLFSSSSAVPVTTSRSPPSARRMLPASSAWLTPAAASTAMLSTVPSRPSSRWAASSVNSTVRLPARLSASPKRATPTTVTSAGPDDGQHGHRSPGARSASSASERSTTTSSPARGPRPVDEVERVEPLGVGPGGTGGCGAHADVVDGLAVRPDDLGEALDARRDLRDTVDAGDPLDHGLVDRGVLGAVEALDRRRVRGPARRSGARRPRTPRPGWPASCR